MQKYAHWILRLVVAGILLQTLYFKFSAHPDSVYIFEQTGLGKAGRLGIGVLELISAVLILLPRLTGYGAVMGIGIISGAIFFHITSLGIEVNEDGGLLFYLAILVFVGCCLLAWINRDQLKSTISGWFK